MAEEEKPIELEEPAEQVDEPEITGSKPAKPKPAPAEASRLQRLKNWYAEHKKWTIPASVFLFILVLAGIPFTRYTIGDLFIKKDITVYLTDSQSKGEIFDAYVRLDGKQATEGKFVAPFTFHNVSLGSHKLEVHLQYYKDVSREIKVDIGRSKQKNIGAQMTATGRLLDLRVENSISGAFVDGAQVKSGSFTTKTDKFGLATLVVDPSLKSADIQISGSSYNDLTTTMQVLLPKPGEPPKVFSLTPAGKVYFLSKLSGKIDVVKTNLDGSARQTVLAGTGNEQDQGTVLLAARDWKYLALLSRRAGSSPTLYLINTSDDSLTTMDEGNVDFSLDGWAGDNFIYTVTRNGTQLWQPNRQAVKSYNAPGKKLTVLDQTTASGGGSSDYLSELIGGVYASYDDQVFYIKNWTAAYTNSAAIAGKQSTFNSVKPDGSTKKAIKSFGLADGTTAIDVTLEERVVNPEQVNLKFSDGTKDNFYVYANGQVKDQPGGTTDSFYNADYPTYLESPSGNNTFWSEPRDGRNTLFIGDESGQNAKQLATLSDYNTYGWYTDNYLLVSKNSSELYVMPKAGSKNPVKISDYHKPALTFAGYGGGYGGL